MDDKAGNKSFWRGKQVFLTGHTGFKGGWLSLWLQHLGAEVHGFSLPAPEGPSLFAALGIDKVVASNWYGDTRNFTDIHAAIESTKPEIVFHLAAQPLVRYSYESPLETYHVNVMGTANLLESIRTVPSVKAIVNVTTDKCYENREWVWPYRESDPVGGHDPYSSSKGCAELVSAAYRRSFFESNGVALATARAGNVIGGGDWAVDRLIPDFLRASDAGQTLKIRYPGAIRPWQHVLEPLSGYMTLAKKLYAEGKDFAQSWNFGPGESSARSVRWIVEFLSSLDPETNWTYETGAELHEARTLMLDSTKARSLLGWRPRWDLETSLQRTVDWHLAWREGRDMKKFSIDQIAGYEIETGD